MTESIPLTKGFVALVDDEDYERVTSAGRWRALPNSNNENRVYAVHDGARGKTVRLHNFLTGWPLTDHINGNSLDNRRVNLRPATKSQNGANRVIGVNNASGFKGVHLDRNRWRAVVRLDGRLVSLGYHPTAEDAARAYDAAALEHFGEFACVNFPINGERSAR